MNFGDNILQAVTLTSWQLHRYESSQYLFHYIATEIVEEWVTLKCFITIFIIVSRLYFQMRPSTIILFFGPLFQDFWSATFAMGDLSNNSQPKGDLRYSGANHNGFKVCFAMEGCVMQSISGLCSILKINMKLMYCHFRSTLLLATVGISDNLLEFC